MDEAKIEALVGGLREARRGRKPHFWQFVAKGADGHPVLLVGRKEGELRKQAKLERLQAKDKRRASGPIAVDDEGLIFGLADGSAPPKIVEKSLRKEVAKLDGIGPAKPWLRVSRVVPAAELPGAEADGDEQADGMGIDGRTQAEARSKLGSKRAKKGSEYAVLLDALDDWHRSFGSGLRADGLPPGELRARVEAANTALDAIDGAAQAWLDSHKKGLLEGKQRKRRRAEVQRIQAQVLDARRRVAAVRIDGEPADDELVARMREAEQAWMDERIEDEGRRKANWARAADGALDDGRYGEGAELGAGTFGRVVLLEADPTDPRLVAKFQTARGRQHNPDDLTNEAAWYERLGDHPNIARCLGVRDVGGEPALVMEALEGGDFASFLERGPQLVADGVLSHTELIGATQHILRGAVRALEHVHAQGLVHSDVKPMNIMVDVRTGEAKLVDLGTMGEQRTAGGMHQTPAYGGVDRVERSPIGADQVGLGASTYEAMEGELPAYRPDEVEISDADAIAATTGLGQRLADLPLDAEHFSSDDLAAVEATRARLQKQQAKRWAKERGRRAYEPGEGGKGAVPFLGAMHTFVNRLLDPDPANRPTLEELRAMPFLDDALLDEEQARDVLARLG